MRTGQIAVVVSVSCLALLSVAGKGWGIEGGRGRAAKDVGGRGDYLQVVRSYADTMLEKGRDRYGKEHSPLFATTLDRKNVEIFDEAGLERLWQNRLDDWDNWRIRNRDRMTTGANPMHDQNLYQVLYALTEITGEKRYAKEADRTIKWF
ncbi:MAG: hypothetical protein ACYSTZ_09250, partial [Planctomycetota bacterium]